MVPIELPGAKVPPEAMDAVPPTKPVPPRVCGVDDNFPQTAVTGGGRDHFPEGGDVRHGGEIVRRAALSHQRDHFVHKAVEAGDDPGGLRGDGGDPGRQFREIEDGFHGLV